MFDTWAGWHITRHGLVAPDGKTFTEAGMRHWWLTIEQARFWRKQYDHSTPRQYELFQN
jgi:hypothetical protein